MECVFLLLFLLHQREATLNQSEGWFSFEAKAPLAARHYNSLLSSSLMGSTNHSVFFPLFFFDASYPKKYFVS